MPSGFVRASKRRVPLSQEPNHARHQSPSIPSRVDSRTRRGRGRSFRAGPPCTSWRAGSPNNRVVLALMGGRRTGMRRDPEVGRHARRVDQIRVRRGRRPGKAASANWRRSRARPPSTWSTSAGCSTTRTCMASWSPRPSSGTPWPRSGRARPARTCTWRRTSRCPSGKAAR